VEPHYVNNRVKRSPSWPKRIYKGADALLRVIQAGLHRHVDLAMALRELKCRGFEVSHRASAGQSITSFTGLSIPK
jgi:hypothetical protein